MREQKIKSERIHAKRRAFQRHGLELSNHDLEEIVFLIRKGSLKKDCDKVHFVDKQSNRITRWFVWFREKWLPVVYDKKRHTVVTFLETQHLGPAPDYVPHHP